MNGLNLANAISLIRIKGAFLFLLVLGSATFHSSAQTFSTDLEDSLQPAHWLGLQTIDTTFAFSGKHASLVNAAQPYGIGFEGQFPETVAGQNTQITCSGQWFSNQPNAGGLFVVTLMEGEQLKYWYGIHLAALPENTGQWNHFSQSLLIPANLTQKTTIKAYFWNQHPEIPMWMDDLQVEFTPAANPSFLPELVVENTTISNQDQLLFNNAYYQIWYNSPSRQLRITDPNGALLVESITYFTQRALKSQPSQFVENLKFIKKSTNGNETQLVFKIKTAASNSTCVFHCHVNYPDLEVYVTERFKKLQEVDRESLVFVSKPPVSQVMRTNRKEDTTDFQAEYWLDKEGAQFGTQQNGWWIYHTPGVSSLQLNTQKNQLWVNLDYAQDHPFFRFPLEPDSNNWKTELSASKYRRGERRQFAFSIHLGGINPTLPRLMKNPAGYLATYIWTEHADWTNIRSNRATYFGSEKITNAKEAVGGFVKYGIPVTKSVFYANPDSTRNSEVTGGRFPELESSILSDPQLPYFLDQIHEAGSEICLHTPEQYTTTPQRFQEAMRYMQTHYQPSSWIDHGNNNGFHNNREDLVCDATLKKSPYYALDLWPKYGVNYLHNSYYEEMPGVDFWQFDGSVDKPYAGFGDFWPKPDYWTHPTYSNALIHWPTTSALFVHTDGLWDYFFGRKKLDEFVTNWGTQINHCYPAWVDPEKGFWTYDADSVMVAQTGFNATLQRMASLRDAGLLNVCTIKSYLDYRTALEKIQYQYFPDGHVEVKNLGNTDIPQLAMVTSGDYILVNGLKPFRKKVAEGWVFWFDLKAGETARFRILNEK